MTANISIREKREELKRRLATDEYATLLDVIVRGVSQMMQRVSRQRNPIAFWYSALMIVLVALLIGLLLSIVLGEFSLRPIIVLILGMGSIYAGVIIFKIHHDDLIACLHDHVVDAIESNEDLVDLEHWLSLTANKKYVALLDLIIVVLGAIFLRFSYFTATGESFGFGPTVSLTIGFTLYGVMVHYGILFSILPNRLSRYRFKLYSADPRSSELIYYLSSMLMTALYLAALYAALLTLLTATEGLFVSLNRIRLLGWWIFITGFFVIIQYTLSSIIKTAKYKTLGEIQAKIDKLLTDANPTDKEMREAITWLMDYHDRLKSTRNSALDLRAILEFVNSLLLPLLAFLLANLNMIVALFR